MQKGPEPKFGPGPFYFKLIPPQNCRSLPSAGRMRFCSAVSDGVFSFVEIGLAVEPFHERVHLTRRLLLGETIPFLNFADELLATTSDDVNIIIGKFAPLFANFTLHLFPFAFELIRIHG